MELRISESKALEMARAELDQRLARYRAERAPDEREALQNALSAAARVDDRQLLEELAALDFDAETIALLPIVPLIAVGWADGSLSAREAQQILELAEERGAAKASPAHQSLSKMLQKAPEQAFVFACIYTLRRIYEALPDEVTKQAKRNLLGYSLVVARASGGILGLFGNKVSDDERSALETIAQTLGIDDDDEEAEPAPAMDAEESASTETEPAEQAENDPSQAPEADNDGEDEEDEEEDDSAEAVKKAD